MANTMANRFIALVGMCGSGKSVVADDLVKRGYLYFRFGQVVMDIVKERKLAPTEENERSIREEVRKKHGMAAMAILNISKIDNFLAQGDVVGDGLYSWSEYKVLKERYGEQLTVIAVYAPPKIRYERLENRKLTADDKELRNRLILKEDAKKRDYAEIENIEKAGPIAMADFTLVNTGTKEDVLIQLERTMRQLEK